MTQHKIEDIDYETLYKNLKQEMASITQAKHAYYNLAKNMFCYERDDYGGEHDCEDPDDVPIDKLEDGNYKDFRVLENYFYKEDKPTYLNYIDSDSLSEESEEEIINEENLIDYDTLSHF